MSIESKGEQKMSHSLFKIDVKIIKRASLNILYEICKARKIIFEREINKIMNRRFFKRKSRDNVIKFIIERSRGLHFVEWRDKWRYDEVKAKSLLDSCRITSGTHAFLSSEYASLVKKWA